MTSAKETGRTSKLAFSKGLENLEPGWLTIFV
jgi:hypothetical protein